MSSFMERLSVATQRLRDAGHSTIECHLTTEDQSALIATGDAVWSPGPVALEPCRPEVVRAKLVRDAPVSYVACGWCGAREDL